MLKPYLVIFKENGLYKSFDCITVNEALALTDRKDLGELICTYNLSTDSVMHIEDPVKGINKSTQKIINQYKQFAKGYKSEFKAMLQGANSPRVRPVGNRNFTVMDDIDNDEHPMPEKVKQAYDTLMECINSAVQGEIKARAKMSSMPIVLTEKQVKQIKNYNK